MRPRRLASIATSLLRLRHQQSALHHGIELTRWCHGGFLSVTEAGSSAGNRAATLEFLKESFGSASAALGEVDAARRALVEYREQRLLGVLAASIPAGGGPIDVTSLEQSMAKRAILEQLTNMSSAEDVRASTAIERVRQLAALAEVVLRLEGLRDASSEGSVAVLEEPATLLRGLVQASQDETALRLAVQQQASMLQALQSQPDPAALHAQYSLKVQTAESAAQQIHSECVQRLEELRPLAEEIERLVADGGAMSSEATALLDELEMLGQRAEELSKLAPDELGPRFLDGSFGQILDAVSSLRTAWGQMQERIGRLVNALLPLATQLGSVPEHMSALPEEQGDDGMVTLERIDAFLESTQTAAKQLYPQLQRLGELASAAADAGAAADKDNKEAKEEMAEKAEPSDASKASRPKQERNVHALTVLRRIKCKLDGRDKWPNKERESKQSVSEQVETVIKQACSPDHLCMMYEGWSGWV